MAFDVTALRRSFPILNLKVHGGPLHYLDNAATSQIPLAVLNALERHETTARANILRSVHFLAEAATEAYEDARTALAEYINAYSSEEVIFTSGCTSAINLVAHSFGARMNAGDEIVISLLEHHSNIVPWQLLRERRGVEIKVLPVTDEGRVDLGALDRIVTPRCKLIAVTHVSNVTGAETDVAPLVAAARAVNAKILLDGAQRVPHGHLDVRTLGVDFYAFSGHKMFGPNGIGTLWGRRDLLADMPPFMGGGEMIEHVTMEKATYAVPPHRFEAGTPPIAQAVGLGAATRWIQGLDRQGAENHMHRLLERLLDGLGQVAPAKGRLRIVGPSSLQSRFPVVSFAIDGAHPHDICQILDQHGVALRGGHHCAQPLMEAFGVGGTTRASLAYYNTVEDIDAFLAGLDDALRRLLR